MSSLMIRRIRYRAAAHAQRTKSIQRRGLALIEMAIVLLLLLLLTFGVIEFGWMFMKMGNVTNAARQGARIAARPNTTTIAQVQAAAQTALTQGGIPANASAVTVSAVPTAVVPGDPITVTVEVNYKSGTGAIGLGMPLISEFTPTKLRARMVIAREGP